MRATQSCMPTSAQGAFLGTYSPGKSHSDLGSVERVLIETRKRIVNALDRELDQIRATRQAAAVGTANQPEFAENEAGATLMEAAPLPLNVLTVSRELFINEAPQEAVLDPALEQATVEELNAALADAFNHVAGH